MFFLFFILTQSKKQIKTPEVKEKEIKKNIPAKPGRVEFRRLQRLGPVALGILSALHLNVLRQNEAVCFRRGVELRRLSAPACQRVAEPPYCFSVSFIFG